MQQTLILIKPDGVQRRLVGSILKRFEQKGLRLAGLKLVKPTHALAEKTLRRPQGQAVLRRAAPIL